MRKILIAATAFTLSLPMAAHAGNFTGFYGGAQIGGTHDSIEQVTTITGVGGQQKTESLLASGVTGTVFGGYGYQLQSFFLGAELYGTFGKREFTFKDTNPSSPFSMKNKFGTEWGGNLRPGYVFNDRALIYALLGVGQVSMSNTGGVLYDKTPTCFSIGLGTEISVAGPLTVRLDYSHTFLPDVTISDSFGDTNTYKSSQDSIKAGFAYHF